MRPGLLGASGVLAGTLAFGQPVAVWPVHVFSEKGAEMKDGNCRPLREFTTDPSKFDYGLDLIGKRASDLRIKTTGRLVGRIAGFPIRDVIHSIDHDRGTLLMKMVLVEQRPGVFCEIFHQQYDSHTVEVAHSRILPVKGRPILATRGRVSGTGAFFIEDYFVFDSGGPVRLDQSVIDKALGEILPAGRSVNKGYGLDMGGMCYGMPVWRSSDANCCPTGGSVRLRLALDGNRLIVTGRHYNPNPVATEERVDCRK